MATDPFEYLRIDDGFWYLATVYSRHPYGFDSAYEHAVKAAHDLQVRGVPVISPIIQGHPVAKLGGLPTDHEYWRRWNLPLMRASHGMLIMAIPEWTISAGIADEIEEYGRMRKPVELVHMEWF